MARTLYNGDINAEYGGYFYNLAGWKWGYADVVRIQPCSDAGGPDNCYWVESLTVNIDPKRLQSALDCIGMSADEYRKIKPAARRHVAIDACLSYGYYDQNSSDMVRIGKPDIFWRGTDKFEAQIILRGNASIRNYARQQFLNG